MSKHLGSRCGVIVLVTALGACQGVGSPVVPQGERSAGGSAPLYTQSSGSSSTLLARSTFSDPHDPNLMLKRISDGWHFELKTMPAMDVAVQSITFAPGAQSGWHTHPGPVLIQVVSGTVTFYEGDDPTCTPIVRTAGQAYLDYGEHPHIARNEGATPAQNIVTYFAPPGASLRIDQPSPGNCPF